MAEDLSTAVQTMLPDDLWRHLFRPAGLAPFVPKRGSTGFAPMLEVYSLDASGQRQVQVIVLDFEEFNDPAQRQEILRTLGIRWALDGWMVYALRLAGEAWSRRLSDEEWAAYDGSGIGTHADRQEIIAVHGSTLDGRYGAATAVLLRDKVGRIRAVRPWQATTSLEADAPALGASLLDVAWEGYTATMRTMPHTPD